MAEDRVVVGIVSDYSQAGQAVDELRRAGFTDDDISVVARKLDAGAPEGDEREAALEARDQPGVSPVAGGAATGGIIGAVGGLLLGLGALVIPGIGPVLAAGPLLGALGGGALGAATGSLVGILRDAGVTEEEARLYERRLEHGQVIVAVHADADDRAAQASAILARYEAPEPVW